MWFAGCQSLVAILMVKGRDRRELMRETISRPFGTARLPFYEMCKLYMKGDCER